MAFQINTNNYSVLAQKNLSLANSALAENIDHLSTGEKLTTARDDAAGLAASEKIRGQIVGLTEGAMNAQDAVSFLQTAEGGLEVISDMLGRMRELAVQAGNGIYTADDRRELQKEIDKLKEEIDKIALSTEFNTRKVLSGEAAGDWSSTKDGVEVIMKSAPAEGNYRIEFQTEPGKNAIYKSAMLMEEFYKIGRKIIYPNGITNVKVEGTDEDSLRWKINNDIIANPATGSDVLSYQFVDVITNAGNKLDGVKFFGGEDKRGLNGLAPFAYPYDNFSGFYLGVECVDYNGTAVKDDRKSTVHGPSQDTLQYIELSDGSIAYKSKDSDPDATAKYFKIFVMDPATGVKQYAAYVHDPNGSATTYAYIQGPPNIQTPDGRDASFEIQFSTSLMDLMDYNDKALYFHQANSPANMGAIKNVEIELPLPAGTDIVNGTHAQTGAQSKNPVVNVFWDLNPNGANQGHANFTALTIENGEFKEVKLEWDWDRNYSFDEVGGTYRVIDLEVLYPSGLKMSDVLTNLPQLNTQENLSKLDITQTLTIYGNNKSVDISVEGRESLQDFMDKLANAIAVGLDMGTEGVMPGDLVMMVTGSETATRRGINALPGSLIIQTAMTGKQSELRFVGSEVLLNALGLVTIQEARENEIHASVFNAHTGNTIAQEHTNDRVLRNVIAGVNINIDSRVGIKGGFDSTNGNVTFTPDDEEAVYLHIVNNETLVQTGANEGQTFGMSLGRMDTIALNIADTYIRSQQDAEKAITKFDQALQLVHNTRADIGAQINRIEFTMKGLSISKENLVAAESRIRNLDVADESVDFAKNQMLINASTAILAQANQLPQTALMLMGK